MKIKIYLAIIILASLLGGYLVEIVLSKHFDAVHTATEKHNKNLLWEKDYERLLADLSQFLVSVDLILGSDETYLVPGALAKSQFILDNLKSMQQLDSPVPLSGELSNAATTVSTITSYLQQVSGIDENDRQTMLGQYLAKSDDISGQLVQTLSVLHGQIKENIKAQTFELRNMNDNSSVIRYLCLGIYSVLILLLWLWANKKISGPMQALTEMAKAAEKGVPFTGISKGVKEVVELSDNTQKLTQSLSYQATHDPLTGLFNRRKFNWELDRHFDYIQKNNINSPSVLCYLDLDHFKIVNDSCGHSAGDELLEQVALILESSIRSTDIIARVGGDEFVILFPTCDLTVAAETCERIRDNIIKIRYAWQDNIYKISASIGLVSVTKQCLSAQEVLNAADTACSIAKESGRDCTHIFDMEDELLATKRNEMVLINQITHALEQNRFVLHRQFITPLQKSEPENSHYEILVRMLSLKDELIYPNNFLPVAEKYQLCTQIDKWVIYNTLDWLLANPKELQNTEICAINLSGQSMSNAGLRNEIFDKLSASKFPAEKICFEITETADIFNLDGAQQFITTLKTLGCKFALDDFGTGLSSFSYLKSLDIDFIKIDGSFVKNMTTNSVNMATVKSISDVAKSMGKQTVAEFVEDEKTAHELIKVGVDYAQGYYYSKPQPLTQDDPASPASEHYNLSALSSNFEGTDGRQELETIS